MVVPGTQECRADPRSTAPRQCRDLPRPVLAGLTGWLALMYSIQHSIVTVRSLKPCPPATCFLFSPCKVPFLTGAQYEYFPVVATFVVRHSASAANGRPNLHGHGLNSFRQATLLSCWRPARLPVFNAAIVQFCTPGTDRDQQGICTAFAVSHPSRVLSASAN